MFVKPARPGLIVRDPQTRIPLPEEGREVDENDMFWQRRLRDGDVVLAQAPQPQPPHAA
jgi:hypothetical protein